MCLFVKFDGSFGSKKFQLLEILARKYVYFLLIIVTGLVLVIVAENFYKC